MPRRETQAAQTGIGVHRDPQRPKEPHPLKETTKKELILEAARGLAKERYTPAEIEQIRRQMIVVAGPEASTSPEYIVSVLEDAGLARAVVHSRG